MNIPPAANKAPSTREPESPEEVRIRQSMTRWTKMNETARLLGRGLGRRELVERVALETGASARAVHDALKRA